MADSPPGKPSSPPASSARPVPHLAARSRGMPTWALGFGLAGIGIAYYAYAKIPSNTRATKDELKTKAEDPTKAFPELARPTPTTGTIVAPNMVPSVTIHTPPGSK